MMSAFFLMAVATAFKLSIVTPIGTLNATRMSMQYTDLTSRHFMGQLTWLVASVSHSREIYEQVLMLNHNRECVELVVNGDQVGASNCSFYVVVVDVPHNPESAFGNAERRAALAMVAAHSWLYFLDDDNLLLNDNIVFPVFADGWT